MFLILMIGLCVLKMVSCGLFFIVVVVMLSELYICNNFWYILGCLVLNMVVWESLVILVEGVRVFVEMEEDCVCVGDCLIVRVWRCLLWFLRIFLGLELMLV